MIAQTVSRVTAKNLAEKIAYKRLSALQLAESLGNVAEACRRSGMDRTSFYEFKRRFQTHGFEGLKDLPPIPKSHPLTTPEQHVDAMLDLAIKNPSWGCMRLSDEMRLRGIAISSPTIQKILVKRGLGSRYDRILRFEETASQQKIEITAEQIRLLETAYPAFRERHVEARVLASCFARIRSMSDTSKASASCTFRPWSIRLVRMPLVFLRHRSCRRAPSVFCTTTSSRFTAAAGSTSARL